MKLVGPWIYRKDIARICNVSVRQVQHNEARWGIDKFKRAFSKKVIGYSELPTLAALREFGALRENSCK